jgi:hypothetical protein
METQIRSRQIFMRECHFFGAQRLAVQGFETPFRNFSNIAILLFFNTFYNKFVIALFLLNVYRALARYLLNPIR